MQVYVFDPVTVVEIQKAGYKLSKFSDVNGVSIWEFSYNGGNLDIGALVKANKALVLPEDSPRTVYL